VERMGGTAIAKMPAPNRRNIAKGTEFTCSKAR
jgi:hypothetical protein